MVTWKQISGHPEYDVSDNGDIRFRGGYRKFGHGARYAAPSTRKLQPHSSGYLQVRLNRVNKYVHRLVAEAFLQPDPAREFVNHKDGDKTNNHASNLEWCTFSENMTHKTKILGSGVGETHSRAKLTWAEVASIRAAKGTQESIATQYGICRQTVSDIRRNRRWVI